MSDEVNTGAHPEKKERSMRNKKGSENKNQHYRPKGAQSCERLNREEK